MENSTLKSSFESSSGEEDSGVKMEGSFEGDRPSDKEMVSGEGSTGENVCLAFDLKENRSRTDEGNDDTDLQNENRENEGDVPSASYLLGNCSMAKEFMEDQRLPKEENFTDLDLVCEDGFVEVHRCLLIGASSLLREMLIEKEITETTAISLPGVRVRHLKQVLSLIYAGKTIVDESDQEDVYNVMTLLQFPVHNIMSRVAQECDKDDFAAKELRHLPLSIIDDFHNILENESNQLPHYEKTVHFQTSVPEQLDEILTDEKSTILDKQTNKEEGDDSEGDNDVPPAKEDPKDAISTESNGIGSNNKRRARKHKNVSTTIADVKRPKKTNKNKTTESDESLEHSMDHFVVNDTSESVKTTRNRNMERADKTKKGSKSPGQKPVLNWRPSSEEKSETDGGSVSSMSDRSENENTNANDYSRRLRRHNTRSNSNINRDKFLSSIKKPAVGVTNKEKNANDKSDSSSRIQKQENTEKDSIESSSKHSGHPPERRPSSSASSASGSSTSNCASTCKGTKVFIRTDELFGKKYNIYGYCDPVNGVQSGKTIAVEASNDILMES